MSGKHQIWVYQCKNCGEKKETMDTKDYLESRMVEYPETFACCKNLNLEQTDQYFR